MPNYYSIWIGVKVYLINFDILEYYVPTPDKTIFFVFYYSKYELIVIKIAIQ